MIVFSTAQSPCSAGQIYLCKHRKTEQAKEKRDGFFLRLVRRIRLTLPWLEFKI